MPAQTKDPQALATAAAEALLAHASSYSEMVEHAGPQWHALADYFETKLTHLKPSEREQEAENMAFYAIGVQVGMRLRVRQVVCDEG